MKAPTPEQQDGTRLAAIDLGSNSYRLEIGQVDHGQIHRVEYFKEPIRQGSGLDEARNLTPEAMQRGWDTLARFAERLAGFKGSQVRAVATQTLREARNREEFLLRARTVLGFRIDVISGQEEARLIYLGVANALPSTDASSHERRLVVDIGGRSTEIILGHGLDAEVMASYRVGCVAWSMKHFAQGQFTPAAFRGAEIAAKAVLDDALSAYAPQHWDVAYGASGTIGAVGEALAAAGGEPGLVTREGLDWLRDRMLKAGSVERLRIEGISEDRKPVIGGGLCVLQAIFDLLEIKKMKVAQGALRHGLLYELLERDHLVADLRATTVARLANQFSVDAAQARRVGETAAALFLQLEPHARGASTAHRPGRALRKLGWAAQLHEIGTRVSHSDYHKHGAYILGNTEAPGFTVTEMHWLSQLVLGHRGKLRKLEIALNDPVFVAQLLALRLAVILCHARRDPELADLKISYSNKRLFTISYRARWAERYPQSAHLLREEALAWQKTDWRVELAVSA
jgi:exopolyphosphatase/guanosine-5'-triphosphate,3'-diphosphate pyrophosphatase